MDFGAYAERLGLEHDEFAELAELFLDACVGDLETLDAAIAAVNAEEAAHAAHAIKGAAGNLGFVELSVIAREIETNARDGILEGSPKKITLLKEKLRELEKIVRGN